MASTRDDRMRTCVCLTFTASVVCLSVAYHARAMCTRVNRRSESSRAGCCIRGLVLPKAVHVGLLYNACPHEPRQRPALLCVCHSLTAESMVEYYPYGSAISLSVHTSGSLATPRSQWQRTVASTQSQRV
jgi:hypothetical protein